MSVDHYNRMVNQLDKELADLEKKLADEMKKEADKLRKISDTQASITKYTSATTAHSKMRQIQGFQSDLSRIAQTKADINKRIADKRKRRADAAVSLQKEIAIESKRSIDSQKQIYQSYERKISELSAELARQQIGIVKHDTHLYDNQSEEEYDVFISHASEDKQSFVDELCEELKIAGIKVWYDALSMTWGDSLRSKIDIGLKKSKYGIVVLSKDYIRKGWTQYELDGLFQIEMMNGKTILPIWHNITKKEVQESSPSLAGKLALNTAMMTPSEIAQQLNQILNIETTQE